MRRSIAFFTAWVLLIGQAVAQEIGGLKLLVLQGDGAFNDIRRKTARDPVVEVRDDKDRIVPGAQVTFSLPEAGPSGTFVGGSRTHTATSDPNGIAAARGLRPNDVEGRFQIRVTATSAGRTAAVVISQSNTLAGGVVATGERGGALKWLLLVAAGGAAGGIVAATRGGKSAPATAGPPPTILSAGTVTVGGPR